jgi:hypothetical protein
MADYKRVLAESEEKAEKLEQADKQHWDQWTKTVLFKRGWRGRLERPPARRPGAFRGRLAVGREHLPGRGHRGRTGRDGIGGPGCDRPLLRHANCRLPTSRHTTRSRGPLPCSGVSPNATDSGGRRGQHTGN